jgi:hypothetical protein
LLAQDQKIGGTTKAIGWIGMLAAVAWLAWRTYQSARAEETAGAEEIARF